MTSAPQHVPITYDRSRPDLDPTVIPAEALLEAEPGDWWTIGRRVRLGRAAAPLLGADGARPVPRSARLPAPYDELADEIDGRAVFIAGVLAGNAIWAEVPSPARRSLVVVRARTTPRRSKPAARRCAHAITPAATSTGSPSTAIRRRCRSPRPPQPRQAARSFPGDSIIPARRNPRWWQLEDRAVDIGGFAPDRSHFATMLLLDVALEHADDWFTFPVPPPADAEIDPSSGVLVTLSGVTVRDSFGEVWDLTAPPATGPGAWSLFHTAGLAGIAAAGVAGGGRAARRAPCSTRC